MIIDAPNPSTPNTNTQAVLAYLQSIKADIRAAIVARGGNVEGVPFEQWGDVVAGLSFDSGGGSSGGSSGAGGSSGGSSSEGSPSDDQLQWVPYTEIVSGIPNMTVLQPDGNWRAAEPEDFQFGGGDYDVARVLKIAVPNGFINALIFRAGFKLGGDNFGVIFDVKSEMINGSMSPFGYIDAPDGLPDVAMDAVEFGMRINFEEAGGSGGTEPPPPPPPPFTDTGLTPTVLQMGPYWNDVSASAHIQGTYQGFGVALFKLTKVPIMYTQNKDYNGRVLGANGRNIRVLYLSYDMDYRDQPVSLETFEVGIIFGYAINVRTFAVLVEGAEVGEEVTLQVTAGTKRSFITSEDAMQYPLLPYGTDTEYIERNGAQLANYADWLNTDNPQPYIGTSFTCDFESYGPKQITIVDAWPPISFMGSSGYLLRLEPA